MEKVNPSFFHSCLFKFTERVNRHSYVLRVNYSRSFCMIMMRSWNGDLTSYLKVPLLLYAALSGAAREKHTWISSAAFHFCGTWKIYHSEGNSPVLLPMCAYDHLVYFYEYFACLLVWFIYIQQKKKRTVCTTLDQGSVLPRILSVPGKDQKGKSSMQWIFPEYSCLLSCGSTSSMSISVLSEHMQTFCNHDVIRNKDQNFVFTTEIT